ncbi:hypothetical protein BDZ89DRAFT_1146013 [Hymenopellis radicata]|nr:hypothetical protein BDZ89DRAFT_1146013 [Hymenopellis radicata]
MSSIFDKPVGRPLGSKDGPRDPNAPRRGRPPKAAQSSNVAAAQQAEDADDEFEDEFSDISEDNWAELERCEEEKRRAKRAESLAREAKRTAEESAHRRRLEVLQAARDNPQSRKCLLVF